MHTQQPALRLARRWRKLFLTTLILFADTSDGNQKLLRLYLATNVCALELCLLAIIRPYRNVGDANFASLSALLLTCLFAAGTILKLCESSGSNSLRYGSTCEEIVGMPNSHRASVIVVLLSLAMLLVALLLLALHVALRSKAQKIRVSGTGRIPNLELPRGCTSHCFISHVWSTGQDQTHTLVRQMQLLLPGIRIWLDVDSLDALEKLEDAVAASAVVVLFLTSGYFRSENCRREIYAARAMGKPIVAVWEAEEDHGGLPLEDHKHDYERFCVELAASADNMSMIFDHTIPWVRQHVLQLEVLKLLADRLIRHLPHYQRHPAALSRGLTVGHKHESSELCFPQPLTLLVSAANPGAGAVAQHIAERIGSGQGLTIRTAELVLSNIPGPAQWGSSRGPQTAFLLYLNSETFLDQGGVLATTIERAVRGGGAPRSCT